jgi:alpha-tubulin suppressor-like RCC1 family protein
MPECAAVAGQLLIFPLPSYPLTGVAATAIALGDAHTCVIVTGGGVKCWGKNENGQLGIGDTVQKISPVDVSLGGVFEI